jgi:hypothetical protein
MSSGRTRTFDTYNQADAAVCIGRLPNHGRVAKVFDLIAPDRTADDPVELNALGLMRVAILDQLVSAGCPDELAVKASRVGSEQMADDLIQELEPGFLVCCKNLTSVAEVTYIPADPSNGYKEVEKLVNSGEWVSVTQIDLGVLLETVKKNLQARIRSFEETKRYSAEAIAEALRDAFSLRDLIESAYQK